MAALAAHVAALDGPLALLVNNAGGARGMDPVGSGQVADWQWMYDVNVLGTLRVTQALLPLLSAGPGGSMANGVSKASMRRSASALALVGWTAPTCTMANSSPPTRAAVSISRMM